MTKQQRKLINDVGHFLKVLYKNDTHSKVKVEYDFFKTKAYIFWKPKVESTGNGHERYYDWCLIDAVKEISDQYSISYTIGITDSFEMNIQIYVE